LRSVLQLLLALEMVACLIVWRLYHKYHDPEPQTPVVVLTIVALGAIAFGFLITQDEEPDM
jgi:hypothetical protein